MEEIADMTFEQAFEELDEVVRRLESGELPLAQSLALFERGMALARLCEGKLDQAEQRVQQLVGIGGERPELTPFEVEG